jgi:hypothetical protein
MDYHVKTSLSHNEQVGSVQLTDARYFILGNCSETRYYSDTFDAENTFTYSLDSAAALLCVSVKYTDIETCAYGGSPNAPEFTITRTIPDADVKLVSWPGKQLIAETHAAAGVPPGCPALLSNQFSTNHIVQMNNIDILH